MIGGFRSQMVSWLSDNFFHVGQSRPAKSEMWKYIDIYMSANVGPLLT